MNVATHGAAIGPDLIELRFQKVRQQNRRKRRQQHMIARPSLRWWLGARPEPPSDGERRQDVSIGSPGDDRGYIFRERPGVARDHACERGVGG
jgi:hypothetical protein